MAQLLQLNDTTIKIPNNFQIEKYNITKAERTADGTMHMDLIAKKRKFLFNYTVLSGSEYDKIIDIIDSTDMFFTIDYVENDVAKSATVYTGAIHSTQFRTDSGAWYWKDVAFDLIER
jgi:hypothetical protein